MKSNIRQLIAQALYPTKAHSLPALCERYGLDPGEEGEAFQSKMRYVVRRLDKVSDAVVLDIAKRVVKDFPDDELQGAIEHSVPGTSQLSELTRRHISEALDAFVLAGKLSLLDMLRKHWPAIDRTPSETNFEKSLADDVVRHAISNDDWPNSEVLERVGLVKCSQLKLFEFLEDVLHPIRRGPEDQDSIVTRLNPILRRDGFLIEQSGQVSGYPVFKVRHCTASNTQPADVVISETLIAFDVEGVHRAWQKGLERRSADPEGAITSAKTLVESVCKQIIEASGGTYNDNDDLPKLYGIAADRLNLAPSQHSEVVFRSILGNCQSVVGNLAALRNKLGDSHGQGKRHVKPLARHAELAINLAGSVATFLVATWTARISKSK
jgi:hypothetical protein